MANIKITVEGPLMDGHKVTFKAPCNCDAVEKLDVRYIKDNEQKSKLFTMKDSHGNDLTGLGNLFFKDAYVDVVLDPNSGSAYLQNAGTNAYIEEKFKTISAGVATPVDNLLSDRADLPLSARQGKILNDSLGVDIKLIDGVPNWSERGADTWSPFKSGAEKVIDTTFNRTATESINYVVDEYFTITHKNASKLTANNFIVILTPTKISNVTGQTTWPQGGVTIPAYPTVTYDASTQKLRIYQVMTSAATNGAAHWHYYGTMSFAIKVYVV